MTRTDVVRVHVIRVTECVHVRACVSHSGRTVSHLHKDKEVGRAEEHSSYFWMFNCLLAANYEGGTPTPPPSPKSPLPSAVRSSLWKLYNHKRYQSNQ